MVYINMEFFLEVVKVSSLRNLSVMSTVRSADWKVSSHSAL